MLKEGAAKWAKLSSLLQEETSWMDGFEKDLNNPSTSLDAEELSEEIDVRKSLSSQ